MSELLSATTQVLVSRLRESSTYAAECVLPYVEAQARWPHGTSYNRVPTAVAEIVDRVRSSTSERVLWEFHRTALVACSSAARPVLAADARSAFLLPFWDEAITEMVVGIEERDTKALDYSSDAFTKDIALASGRVWHGGAQFIEPRMGFSRRALLQGGMPTLANGLRSLLQLGGNYPLYEIHTAAQCLRYFSADGWTECYRRIGQALRSDPVAKGVFGTAWFFDPVLRDVSPNLAYLYQFPLAHGATFLRVANTESSNNSALMKSTTRRRLYEERKYSPQQYLMLWPRDAIMSLL